MKIAKLANEEQVTASGRVPNQAICLFCGGKVVLRKRKKMGGNEMTYYWRHMDGKNNNCPARWKLH